MKPIVSPNTRSIVFLVNGFFVYTQKVNGQNEPVLVLDAELKEGEEMLKNWAQFIAEKNNKLEYLVKLHQDRLETSNS